MSDSRKDTFVSCKGKFNFALLNVMLQKVLIISRNPPFPVAVEHSRCGVDCYNIQVMFICPQGLFLVTDSRLHSFPSATISELRMRDDNPSEIFGKNRMMVQFAGWLCVGGVVSTDSKTSNIWLWDLDVSHMCDSTVDVRSAQARGGNIAA